MQFDKKNYNSKDLAQFSHQNKQQSNDLVILQNDEEVSKDLTLIDGCIRIFDVIPGLVVCTLKGTILGEFVSKAPTPSGLSLFMGFKANGHTEYGKKILPHQTLPNLLYIYRDEPFPIKQVTNPGAIETISIHFANDEFIQLLGEHCINDAEKDIILQGLSNNKNYSFWRPQPIIIEALHSLILTEQTGIDLKLFINQTVISVLRSLISYILDQSRDLTIGEKKKLKAKDVRLVNQAVYFIEDNLSQKLTLRAIAQELGCNETYLKQTFPRLHGDSVPQFVLETRMNVAHIMLAAGTKTIQQVAAAVGYANQASFTTAFKKYHSMTPKEASLTCL